MYGFLNESIIRHDFVTGKGKWYNVYRTRSDISSGYIFAPYIPLQVTPTIYESNNFQPRESIMSRYTTRMVNNRFYGTINVSDFDSLGND